MATSETQKTPASLLVVSVVFFASAMLFLMAFSSPNWFEKGEGIASTFVKMGLWEVCFDGFQHPRYLLQRKIQGCNWVFSLEYNLILQDYLEPSWFITVQLFASVAFLITMCALLILAGVVLNCCMYNMPYWLLVMAALSGASGVLNFLAVCMYGARADDREWLPDAQWHHFGWSYYFYILAMLGQLLASALFFLERRRAARHPPPPPSGGASMELGGRRQPPPPGGAARGGPPPGPRRYQQRPQRPQPTAPRRPAAGPRPASPNDSAV